MDKIRAKFGDPEISVIDRIEILGWGYVPTQFLHHDGADAVPSQAELLCVEGGFSLNGWTATLNREGSLLFAETAAGLHIVRL
jgi:hypothetical protein